MKKNNIAFLFPGQGSQYLNMGKDFYENFSIYKQTLEEGSDILKRDLKDIIFLNEEDLKETKNSQIAIFITSVGILKVLQHLFKITPQVSAGLSLGEYSALFATKKISFKDSLFLIEKRAFFMQQACKKHKGGMAAIIGTSSDMVKKMIENIKDLYIANFNTEDQTIITGSLDSIKLASNLFLEKKIKIVPLNVSGAFHSPFMMEAKENFKKEIDKIDIKKSDIKIVMNVDGIFAKEENIKNNLINQITKSVMWKKSIFFMLQNGINTFIEIGPKKTLSKMNKKNAPFSVNLSLEKISDLEKIEKSII